MFYKLCCMFLRLAQPFLFYHIYHLFLFVRVCSSSDQLVDGRQNKWECRVSIHMSSLTFQGSFKLDDRKMLDIRQNTLNLLVRCFYDCPNGSNSLTRGEMGRYGEQRGLAPINSFVEWDYCRMQVDRAIVHFFNYIDALKWI